MLEKILEEYPDIEILVGAQGAEEHWLTKCGRQAQQFLSGLKTLCAGYVELTDSVSTITSDNELKEIFPVKNRLVPPRTFLQKILFEAGLLKDTNFQEDLTRWEKMVWGKYGWNKMYIELFWLLFGTPYASFEYFADPEVFYAFFYPVEKYPVVGVLKKHVSFNNIVKYVKTKRKNYDF